MQVDYGSSVFTIIKINNQQVKPWFVTFILFHYLFFKSCLAALQSELWSECIFAFFFNNIKLLDICYYSSIGPLKVEKNKGEGCACVSVIFLCSGFYALVYLVGIKYYKYLNTPNI